MTPNRRLRLLRLRGLEHRIAALGVARADAALANVAAIETRVERLRANVGTGAGPTSGRALQTLSELAARLDDARDGLAVSRAHANGERAVREAVRVAAHRSQERADRLHQSADAREVAERDRRAATAFAWRKRKTGIC